MNQPNQHTPGPLKTLSTASHFWTDARLIVIDVPQPSGMPDEEWQANKRLYGHAPELVEALQALLQTAKSVARHVHSSDLDSAMAQAERALTAATRQEVAS